MQTLDIKYIQYDTLTYLVLPSLVASGQQAKARQVMQSVVGFHRSCQHSGPDDMAQVFKHESFTKIKEFRRFRNRL
eukprot:CAMPEP_0174369958 /NCGR_PEP_ID=MMETSP0811_2-20130205/94416_1 /TAXON_ID=73025 ORGANISM="Eutreptiella gymnastica-like, Strain CCMP1594" /NCGR_SAMPLE_ID=MMETSP0811_2 /ASSEMBLY_ACC=CAM_ASM_000667 /LENGTH=75 /DNA_ID=CAMNT_0015514925 /DNA_START=195 /DNA_END=419 /DNA_ORIENTATION=-